MQRKYIFKKTGEEVNVERWGWAVLYKDGSILRQFEDNGEFHQIGEVDQQQVEIFTVYKIDDVSKRFDLLMPTNAKLIYKYRNVKPFYSDDFIRVYMFGYKKDNSEYVYNFILPNDTVIMSDVDNVNLEKFLYDEK